MSTPQKTKGLKRSTNRMPDVIHKADYEDAQRLLDKIAAAIEDSRSFVRKPIADGENALGKRWATKFFSDNPAFGSTRPGAGFSGRPGGAGVATLPSGVRPGAGVRPPSGTLPGIGTLPAGGTRPSTRDLPNFVDLPSIGSGIPGTGRPATHPISPGGGLAGGALIGGASAAFLNNYPTGGLSYLDRVPGLQNAVSTLPARPGGGISSGSGLGPSAGEYAAQAEAIATNIPTTKPSETDWMPLGVFAITADGKPTGADPTLFLQLAVSKQGVVSGTLQNTETNSAQSIEGMVDKQSQRTAWTAADKTRPLMEAGISNLTRDTTPALIHFPDGTTQQWLLVRMEKPDTTDTTRSQ